MKQTKDTNGITIPSLVIMITIMVILAAVTITTGDKQIATSEEEKLLSELEIVKYAVYERYVLYSKTNDSNLLIGEKVSDNTVLSIVSSIDIELVTIPTSYKESEKAYYRLNPANLSEIGVQNAQDNYIVNYITGEVINETKKTTKSGKALYTYSRAIFENNDVTAF